MIFRLSQKLNTKIKTGNLKSVPLDENPFADWSAHLFVADRAQYVILTNTKSLFSTVMFGKGITDGSHFILRALSSIRQFMEYGGQEFAYHRFIAPASATVQFAKGLDRSVTGSINDMVKIAKYMFAGGEIAPFEVGFHLNETPMSALRREGDPCGMPRDAFKRMLSGGA